MYYKIENQECKVYKKLKALREQEIQFEKENRIAIYDKTGLFFEEYLGKSGQQTFDRVTSYSGFGFTDVENVSLKTWSRHKDYPNIFIPNKRTKLGKEMATFLSSGLKRSCFSKPFEILGVDCGRKFTFPFIQDVDGVIFIFWGDNETPKDENVIEITSVEFNRFVFPKKSN